MMCGAGSSNFTITLALKLLNVLATSNPAGQQVEPLQTRRRRRGDTMLPHLLPKVERLQTRRRRRGDTMLPRL
jgi:hypothetical protein